MCVLQCVSMTKRIPASDSFTLLVSLKGGRKRHASVDQTLLLCLRNHNSTLNDGLKGISEFLRYECQFFRGPCLWPLLS